MAALRANDRVLITGGTGLIGTNLHANLQDRGYEAIAVGSEYDLRSAEETSKLFRKYDPTVVFHLAARVGGIYANVNFKADFYSDNVLINTHVVNECVSSGIEYVFAMGTGCAYPKKLEAELLHEESFLDGIPEQTNDAYAYAKRGLLVHLMAHADAGTLNYTYCLPANIYGPHDNFHPQHSHVVPGLVRRFCDAKQAGKEQVTIWGDGTAKRDFLYIDDCVSAMLQLAEAGYSGPINVATGELTTIGTLAETIKEAAGFQGTIEHDSSFPTGQLQRRFDTSKMESLGWRPKRNLMQGIQETVDWFMSAAGQFREK